MKTTNTFLGTLMLLCIATYAQNNTTLSTVETSGTAGTGGKQNVNIGYQAANATTGYTGLFCYDNVMIGFRSGYLNTDGRNNTFVGSSSGYSNTGRNNAFIGYTAGKYFFGEKNSFLGAAAGTATDTLHGSGNNNVFLGDGSGTYSNGNGNVFIGSKSGYNQRGTGSKNVFIGFESGGNGSVTTNQSNRLYIGHSNTNTPLIYGEFDNQKLRVNGKVAIGSFAAFPPTISGVNLTGYSLFVKGGVLAEEVRVRTGWADYVFNKNYILKTLPQVEEFIAENGHLPNIPSAKQVEAEGVSLGEMVKLQQEKIEELTLYLITQNKEIQALKAKMGQLENNLK